MQINERGFEQLAFIDSGGHTVLEERYLTTGRFRGGLCLVQNEKKNGYIDRDGTFIWSAPWVEIGSFDPLHLMP